MVKKFKSRNENFGKVVFDPNNFKHFLMTEQQYNEFSKNNDVEEMSNNLSKAGSGFLYSPIRTYFDLTLACNLRCRTCLNSSDKALNDELSLEQAIDVVEGLAKDSVFDIRFSGGEPTLKLGWEEILNKAKELGMTFSLNSNGIYADSQTVDKIIKINPDEISISIDGYKKHNDSIRGKGNYNKAEETVKALSSAGCRVTINSAVTSILDESDIRGLLELANDYCKDISFFHARPLGRALRIKDKLLSYHEINDFMDKVEQIKLEYPTLVVRTRSSSLKQNAINQSSATDFSLMEGGTDGFTRFNIMSNGDLYAGGCVLYVDPNMKQQLVLGNIVDENYSLLNVWRNSERLYQIRQKSLKHKQKCNICMDYEKKCHGFTLEMELYDKIHGNNPYCIKSRGD